MSVSKISTQRRKAIYEAYAKKCFYCGQHIDWDNLEIDHLIAEKTHDLKQLLKDYGLPEDYDINDLTNLVPAHSFCNNRKNNTPFGKATYLFYRSLTDQKVALVKSIEDEIAKGLKKDKVISNIAVAIENKELTLLELQECLSRLLDENWRNKLLHLSTPVNFVGQTIEELPVLGDYSTLHDIHLDINNEDKGVILTYEDSDVCVQIHTLSEWREYTAKGFYPLTNCDIKLSGYFDYLDKLLIALLNIKRPKYSPVEGFVFTDIYQISSSILIDPDESLKQYGECSVGWLVENNLAKVEVLSENKIRIVYEGFEHYLIEQFRGDVNGDEIEDIFVLCSYKAVGGTLGWTCPNIFGRYAKSELVHIVANPWTANN